MIRLLSKRDLSQATVEIHPLAKPAFQFFHTLNHQFDPSELPTFQNLSQSLNNLPLHAVVKNEQPHYLLFSGFEHRFFNINQAFTEQTAVLVYSSELGEKEIEEYAWQGVMRCVLSSIRSDSLSQLHELINQYLPPQLSRALFGKTHLSQSCLANISGTTRSTIAKQKKRSVTPIHEPVSSPTIFEQLTQND